MDLPTLVDFNLVASHGGFGRASRLSGRPKATLSRHVMELEQSLGVRLVERGTRTLRLTEEGAALHARTQGLLGEIADAGEALRAGAGTPRGRLRISAPVLFAHTAMGRLAAGFVARYPGVRLEVTADDRFVDPVEDGYDLVIRTNPRPDDSLVGRRFLRDEMLVAAVPSLACPGGGAFSGTGHDADTPVSVPAVVLSATPETTIWRIPHASGSGDRFLVPDPVLRLSSLIMVRDAVLGGAGAALLPRSMIANDLASGRLASWGVAKDRSVAVWALYPSRRLPSIKVTAFMHCLSEAFPDASL